mgnify:CR=1 FL=1
MSKELDLSCFSYIASAKVLQIDKYPEINKGAEVLGIIDTLAADAPMVAIAASRLKLKVGLIANQLGEDEQGKIISKSLRENKVINSIRRLPGRKTPFIIVLSDKGGNREWFSYTKEAERELMEVNLSQIKDASLAYIDLYPDLEAASLRAISFASENQIPVFLNLSGYFPSPELLTLLDDKNICITQIGIHESQEDEAEAIAKRIYRALGVEVSIVTLGSRGAFAVSGQEVVRTKAHRVHALHFHGAGAVFSAGFTYGYLQNLSLTQNLEFACAFGSLSCTKARGFEDFTLDEINKLINKKDT